MSSSNAPAAARAPVPFATPAAAARLPALAGWSPGVRRWLARQLSAEPSIDWLCGETALAACALQVSGGAAQHLAALRTVAQARVITVDNLSLVVVHHIERSLGRTLHLLRLLGEAELRYAFDAQGRLTMLHSLGLRARLVEPATVVFSVASVGQVAMQPDG
jgi:hypothetical protein